MRFQIVLFTLALPFCLSAESATWYVDDVTDPLEDGSVSHPFDAIQEGLAAATNGDTVLILDGLYSGPGNRDLDPAGKSITIESESGASNAIIDCQSAGRGFIFHSGETTNCRILGLRICNGSALVGAGIACFSNSCPVIENCEIVTNRAWTYYYNIVIGNTDEPYYSVEDAADGRGGGGIYCESSELTIRDCLIEYNETGGDGGGICSVSNSSVRIEDCTLSGNHAALARTNTTRTIGTPGDPFYWVSWSNRACGRGGGVYSEGGSLVVSNCTISANDAGFGGGVYAASNLTLILEGCLVEGNTAVDNATPAVGGGVAVIASSPSLVGCVLDGNHAGSEESMLIQTINTIDDAFYRTVVYVSGGGLGGGFYSENATSTVLSTTCRGNRAAAHGGGIYLCENSACMLSNCIVSDNAVLDNMAPGAGGGLSCWNSSVTGVQCGIGSNFAGQIVTTTVERIGMPGDAFYRTTTRIAGAGLGGGLYIKESSAFFSDSTFNGNGAAGQGGGLFVFDSECAISNCAVSCNSVRDTETPGAGGGVACRDAAFTAIQSDIATNEAGCIESSTIMHVGEPEDSFYRVTVMRSGEGYGGGLFASASAVTLTACRVLGNTSHGDGGGMYLLSNSECLISGSSLAANEAVQVETVEVTTQKTAAVFTTVYDVRSIEAGSGGAVFCSNALIEMRACAILENRAGAFGGGLFVAQSVPLLRNCFLIDNIAGAKSNVVSETWWPPYGSGISKVVASNSADGFGAGLYSENATPLLHSSTVAGNIGTNIASGICLTSNTIAILVNTIVWSNGLYVDADSAATAKYSCVEGGWTGDGNISNHPQLTADWRLTSLSPCIDAGTSTNAPASDFNGEGRWDHPSWPNVISIVDIGADEFVDTEIDGFPDHWEYEYFGDLSTASATNDADHDELTDADEYQFATNPTNSDSDGDRVSDGWEMRYGFNPRKNDSSDDPDADGFSTKLEYLADTSPTNELDYLRMTDVVLDSVSNAVVRWHTSSNRVYAVETSSGPVEPWSFVTNVPGTGADATFTNEEGVAGVRMIRIKAQLP